MEWKKIYINSNLIKAETSKSVLIAMPSKSEYKGYKFWHPAKLVRDGWIAGKVSISYTNDFVFRLKKYGNGKYNERKTIDEITLDAESMVDAFKSCADDYEPDEPEIFTPEPLEPEGKTADDSLIDYE